MAQTTMTPIPVIDLFAGPGGLSEGFASVRTLANESVFDVRLSIEKDPVAHRTLALRAFFRSFENRVPDAYYDYMRGEITGDELWQSPRFADSAELALAEAHCMQLGKRDDSDVSRQVKHALKGAGKWILIGGPPCQAYSLVGRSRMKSSGPRKFEKDERHYLYKAYLKVIAEHAPSLFVMENVKGLLSSTIGGRRIFEQIIEDLSRPNGGSLKYRVIPLAASVANDLAPERFVVRAERHGVPQARHRVILCGVREDIAGQPKPLPETAHRISVNAAIGDLPSIRSVLSRETDSHEQWLEALASACARVKRAGRRFADMAEEMENSLRVSRRISSNGGRFVSFSSRQEASSNLLSWLRDPRIGGVTAHEARSHMRSDLERYFFAASFAAVRGLSPKLKDFPTTFLPDHRNVGKDGSAPFEDRFRVQLFDRPASTVVSHIAKDGHYFIHPHPAECRSLTVREAARLQTFPDNYHFEGNRTQQFVQVGNAVPPYLARQLAQSISRFLAPELVDASSPRLGSRAAFRHR